MREKIRDLSIRRQTQLSLDEIANRLNPLLRGWIQYYGRFAPSALHPLLRYVNQTLLAWATQTLFHQWAHGQDVTGVVAATYSRSNAA